MKPSAHSPLWWLPLAAGLMPAVGSLTALALSIHQELIVACNPFLDGCVSISRAARYGLANHVFRAFTLPAAALQALSWILVALWLRPLAPRHSRSLRALPWLALVAAIALIAYGTFLGTEGRAYRWLRANGTVLYFGLTCLCMIVAGGAIREAALAKRIHAPRRLDTVLLWLAATLVSLGWINAMLGPMFDEPTKDRIENITEWWAALIFTLVFVALAILMRHNQVGVSVDRHRASGLPSSPVHDGKTPAPNGSDAGL